MDARGPGQVLHGERVRAGSGKGAGGARMAGAGSRARHRVTWLEVCPVHGEGLLGVSPNTRPGPHTWKALESGV